MIDGATYYTYFKHQAENHPLLLHTTDNLVFAQVSVEEAFGDLRDEKVSASGYIMRLIRPSFRVSGGPMLPVQTFDGGFLIARRYDARNMGTEDFREAMNGCEAVAIDIVEKMYADSTAGHPMFQARAHNDLTFSAREKPVTGDGSFGGWLILWSLPAQLNYCSPADRTAWVDGGITPVV